MNSNDNRLLSLNASQPRWSPNRWVIASVALHTVVLGVFLLNRAPKLAAVERPGDRNGHNLLVSYSPGDSSPVAALQARVEPPKKTVTKPTLAPPVKADTSPAAPSTAAGTATGSGNDALGDGQITLALELQHPYPRPDLSKLPAGTRGDVIVDVVIDAQGHIAKFTVAHGLGHGIDETVLATIQQWTFQPATRNGVPVPSEQELLFHYERG